jgi:hypothetical protein
MKNITLLLLLTLLAAFVFASPEAEAAPAPDQYGPNKNGADVWESNFVQSSLNKTTHWPYCSGESVLARPWLLMSREPSSGTARWLQVLAAEYVYISQGVQFETRSLMKACNRTSLAPEVLGANESRTPLSASMLVATLRSGCLGTFASSSSTMWVYLQLFGVLSYLRLVADLVAFNF